MYFQERRLIPAERFCEVGFKELETDALGQVRRIYETLDLPDFGYVEPRLRAYLETVSGYKKNQFHELPSALRGRIAREWRQYFEEWKYVM